MFVSPGRELAGHVEVVPIGIPDDVVASFDLKDELLSQEMVSGRLPQRPPDGHKGTFGRLFVLAGSTGMTGAASLAALSALRAGCGLVTVGTPKSIQPVLAIKLTEALTHPLPDVKKSGKLALRGLGEIRQLIDAADAAVIGPGIGQHHETKELIRRLIPSLTKPGIIDADALNACAGQPGVFAEAEVPLVITPHPGEFARLNGQKPPADIRDRLDTARVFAEKYKLVLVLKGSPTIVASPEGFCYLNATGNNGMATGGSGDVLSGLIGSFLAQGMSALDAALCGVYIHGFAGDLAADELTTRAMIAGDIIDFLPSAFEWLE
ncbi:MAG: NAD(P)H-hydrate dehydratase [Candidatus Zixiibacteriota bacterium]|nr:MAG: NAD(P)H-hydrate dehydratase [candidate division Zixibacteria bacterium]